MKWEVNMTRGKGYAIIKCASLFQKNVALF